jgi:hypothetical protein
MYHTAEIWRISRRIDAISSIHYQGRLVRIKPAQKILIGTAIVFSVFFGIWELKSYTKTADMQALVIGILSVLVAIVFGIYFRSLKWRDF